MAAAAFGLAGLLYLFGWLWRPSLVLGAALSPADGGSVFRREGGVPPLHPTTPAAGTALLPPNLTGYPPARRLAAVEADRAAARRLDPAHPTTLARSVDYAEGRRGRWWPRREAPVLAALVRQRLLPPVAERTGPEPAVLEGVEGVGRYGGDWYRLVNANNDYSTLYWRLSGSNLVRWSPDGYPIEPHVARAWEASPDFRVWTFTLRRGMRWSDGQPFSADDLLYWYRDEIVFFGVQSRLMRGGGPIPGRVEKLDDLHARFVFDAPNPLFLERLASTPQNPDDYSEYLVPAHYLRRYHPALGDAALIRRTMQELRLSSPVAVYKRMKDYLNPEHPRLWPWVYHTFVASGPKTLVRNPYYFCVDPRGAQLPYLDRLVMDIKSNDLIAISAANGEPSMQDRHLRYADYSLLMGAADRGGFQVYHWKSATQSPFTLFPNLNRRVDPTRPETAWKHALLNDRRFRQALSLAINRRDIITAEFNGQTEPAQLDPGPDSPYHDERLFRSFTAYDPAAAGRLLDAAGLGHRDRAGFRTYPDGTAMTWVLNLTDYTVPGPAHFICDDWAKVGVRAQVRERSRKLFEQEKYALEHDFTVWTGESEFYPLVEPRSFVPVYIETFYAPAFGAWYQDGGLYGDPAANRPSALAPPPGHPLRRAMELLDDARRQTSEAARRDRVHQILEIAADNVWTISVCTPPPQLVVVKDGFRNVPRHAIFGSCFQSPANTGIETYFWQHPVTSAAALADTAASIRNITPAPDALAPEARGRRWGPAIAAAAALALLGLGLRFPFVGRRLLFMIPTLLIMSVAIFAIIQAPPGDFVDARLIYLEMQGTPSNDQLAADLRRDFHLDEPAVHRYARWLGLEWFRTFRAEDEGLLQGNLGRSMEYERPVNEIIGERLRLTLLVTIATVGFTWLLALPLGVWAAVRAGSARDHSLTVLGFIGLSVPSFLLALLIMYLANRWFGLKVDGLLSPEYATRPGWPWAKIGDLLRHLWLPVVVMGAGGVAGLARVMRANVLDELRKPYVMTARAKGLRPVRVLWKYPVRLALNPFASEMGALFPSLVSGGTIVALVLSLPMIGPTLLDALMAEDVYLAGSMLMVLSVLGVAGTLVSDLVLLWLDPRVRLE